MPEIPGIYLKIAALIVVGLGALFDLRNRKIPNKLTFPASAIGIIMQAVYFASWSRTEDLPVHITAGACYGILGWISGVFIMSITKLFMRQFGHGDTKLVAAAGSFLGPWLVLLVYFYYSLCFGFYTMSKLAMALPWQELWLASEMKKAGMSPASASFEKFNQVRKETLPVAPFIAMGTLCAVLLEEPTLKFFGL